jgi:hypothetical protein
LKFLAIKLLLLIVGQCFVWWNSASREAGQSIGIVREGFEKGLDGDVACWGAILLASYHFRFD